MRVVMNLLSSLLHILPFIVCILEDKLGLSKKPLIICVNDDYEHTGLLFNFNSNNR